MADRERKDGMLAGPGGSTRSYITQNATLIGGKLELSWSTKHAVKHHASFCKKERNKPLTWFLSRTLTHLSTRFMNHSTAVQLSANKYEFVELVKTDFG